MCLDDFITSNDYLVSRFVHYRFAILSETNPNDMPIDLRPVFFIIIIFFSCCRCSIFTTTLYEQKVWWYYFVIENIHTD